MTRIGPELSRSQAHIRTLRTPALVRWATGTFVVALTLLTDTCKVGDLTNPPAPLGMLAVSPAAVVDSAAVGSAARRAWTVVISNAGQGVLSWTVHPADGRAWVAVSPMSGTAPGTVSIMLDPAALAPGTYRDTVMLSADGASNSPTALPIEFSVRPCATTAVALDALVSDSLRTSDCAAPHRAGRFARLYSFAGAPGDSITVALASSASGPYIALDSSSAPTAPSMAEAASCPGQSGACLSYVLLSRAGTYVVEATSVTAGQTGAYSLSLTRPRPPNLPDSPRQLRSDSVTAIPAGGAVDQATVVVDGLLSDPNAQDTSSLRLEVEVRPVGTAFSGTPTASSSPLTGRHAFVRVPGLSNTTSYHWQARTADQTGRTSAWTAFGGNPESATDFTVAVPPSAAQSTVAAAPSPITAGTGAATITVTARDANGNPVSGATVVLVATGSGNTLTQPLGPTNASGVVTGSLSSTMAEGKTVSATVSGIGITQKATVTVRAAAPSASQSQVVAAPASIIAGSGAATITVTARDANGNPVSGATVVLVATGNGNTLTQPAGPTNASGVVTATLSSTAAERKAVTATVNSGVVVNQTATVTVCAALPSQIAKSAGDSQSATAGSAVATPPAALVSDQFGNPVAGVGVTFAVVGSGAVTPTTPVATNASGIAAAAAWTLGPAAGANTVTASATGLSGSVTFTATGTVGTVSAAQSTVAAAPSPITAGTGAATITVTARDANGNPVSGATVVLVAMGSGNTLTQPVGPTDASGGATGTISSTVAQVKTVSATVNGIGITQTAVVTVNPAAPSVSQSEVVAAPASIIAGSTGTTVTVTVKDGFGNAISGATVVLTAMGSDNTVTQPSGPTNASGVVTATLSSTKAEGKTVTATVNGSVVISQTAAVTVGAALPAQIAKSGGDHQSATAGAAVATPPAAVVSDQFGNPVAGVGVTFAVVGSGSVNPTTPVATNASGIAAAAAWTLGPAAGPDTVTASATGVSGSVTFTATGTVGTVSAAQSTVAAAPTPITAGTGAATITVTARDVNGNPVSGATVVLVAMGSSNTLTQPVGPTDASGVATGTLSSTVAQVKTVSATVSGIGITQTATISVGAGLPALIAKSAGDSQSATAGTGVATPPAALVSDQFGNPVAGVGVTFAVVGSGSVNPTTPVATNASGIAAAAAWILGPTVGTNTVTASATGVSGSVTFTATGTVGAVSAAQSTVAAAPTSIAAGTGAATITVTARDANGNPVSGATVVLVAMGSSNTLTQPVGPTDASGVATGTLSSTVAQVKTVSATVSGIGITQMAVVAVTAAAPSASQSEVVAAPATITASTGLSAATITVTVRDANGNLVSGQTVTLTAVPATGNAVTQPAGTTDLNGQITGTLSSTAVGTKTVTATVNGSVTVTQAATVAVHPGAASAAQSTVSATSPIVAGGGTSTITVTVTDDFGNVTSGATVLLAVSGTGNTLTQPVNVTDANGVATGTLSSTVPGLKTVTATVNGSAVTQTATVTATAGPVSAAQSTIAAGTPSITASTGTSAATLTVTAKDALGNPVSGAMVVLTAMGDGNTLTQPAAVTDASGVATGTLSSTVAQVKSVSATVNGTGITQTATISVTAAAAAQIAKQAGDNQTALVGTAVPTAPAVRVTDAFGNSVDDVLVTFAVPSGGGSALGPTSDSNIQGVATVGAWVLDTVAGPNTLTATVIGLAGSPLTFTATGVAGSATNLMFTTQPAAAAQAGVAFTQQPAVQFRDAHGNPVHQAGVSVTATVASGSLGGTTTVSTDVTGVASFTNLAIAGLAGSYTLGFASGSLTAASNPIALSAGPPAQIAKQAGDNQTALVGTAVPVAPAVLVTDGFGNHVDAVIVTFAVALGGGSLVGATPGSNMEGVATVGGWTLGTFAGPNTLNATVTGLAGSPLTFTATGVAGSATNLMITTEPAGAAQAGVALSRQPVVQLRDAYGNPVNQAGVAVTATVASGSLGGTTTVSTDVTGVATFTDLAIAGLAGSYTLGFASGSLTAASNPIVLSPGPPAQVAKHAGDNQTAPAGTAVAVAPAVLVTDAYGNPVMGVPLTFVASGGGAVNPTAPTPVATDASGVAAVTSWTLSAVAGSNTLDATATGLIGSPLRFNATGTMGGPSGVTSQVSASPATIAASTGANQSTIRVTVRDASGNPVSGRTVTLAAVPATGNALTQPAGTTDLNGQITGTLSSTKAEPKTVTATVDGSVTISATALVTVTSAQATQLSFAVQPTNATAGQAIAPAVQVGALDGFGNIATTFSDAVTMAIAGGTGTSGASLHGTQMVSAAAGVATFANLSIDSAGTGYQLTASAAGVAGTTSTAFANVAGPATSLSFTAQPSDIAAGAQMAPGVQVTARDAAGNRATSFAGNVSVGLGTNPNSGRLYGTTTAVATAGVAAFADLTVDSAAVGYTLRAVNPSLSTGASNQFSVAAAASAVLIGAGDIAKCTGGIGKQGATNALLQANPLATVFTAGDQAYENGTLTEYQTCYDPTWGQQKARTRPAPGNHDYQTIGAAGYYGYFGALAGDSGKGYYSYDLGAWHVISLNGETGTNLGSPQELWLKADLSASTKTCTLAYIHRPRFSAGYHGSNVFMQPLWQDLYTAGAELYIAGHNHDYERFAPQDANGLADPARGIREFVIGTGGAGAEPWSTTPPIANEEAWANPTVGVLKLTLYTNTYTWEFVPVAGETFTDSGSGSCH